MGFALRVRMVCGAWSVRWRALFVLPWFDGGVGRTSSDPGIRMKRFLGNGLMANKLDCVCIAWVLTLIFVVGAEGQGEVGNNVYRIPRVSDVKVDGSGEDWGGGGFLVDVMADVEGGFRAPGDFDPKLRLGWNEAGLLILAQVSDDGFSESDIDRRLFLADSLEFFIGTSRDEHDYFMLLVAPGVDPKHPEQRHIFFDERNGGPVGAATRSKPLFRGATLTLPRVPGCIWRFRLMRWIAIRVSPRPTPFGSRGIPLLIPTRTRPRR